MTRAEAISDKIAALDDCIAWRVKFCARHNRDLTAITNGPQTIYSSQAEKRERGIIACFENAIAAERKARRELKAELKEMGERV